MTKRNNIIYYGVTRAADGSYDLSADRDMALLQHFFDNHSVGPDCDQSRERWQRIYKALEHDHVGQLPVVVEVDDWKRPFEHILLDLIDAVQRMPAAKAYRRLVPLGDDRDWFIARAASRIVEIRHEVDPGDKIRLPATFPMAASTEGTLSEIRAKCDALLLRGEEKGAAQRYAAVLLDDATEFVMYHRNGKRHTLTIEHVDDLIEADKIDDPVDEEGVSA